METQNADCEFIVVGSGAGGGTVAARLAEEGRTVILLEAGGDPCKLSGDDPIRPGVNCMPADYEVPAFHASASENSAMKWDFFVRHYADIHEEESNPAYRPEQGGVLYPRAGTLGGCTAHNAMIFVYPHNADWNFIADLTGDQTWRPEKMRSYFQKLENCGHRPLQRFFSWFGFNPSRHGWRGWLPTEKALPFSLLESRPLRRAIEDAGTEAFFEDGQQVQRIRWFIESGLDPNDWRLDCDDSTGIRYLPLTTEGHKRTSTRERVMKVAERFPKRLKVILNALATRVIFNEENRAIGVEYLQGEKLYKAHAAGGSNEGKRASVYASHEVILAGGAFNTPQLLMLSGVGPREELERYGIEVRADLPGVGRNLQDRYEIGVVNRMKFKSWDAFKGATFTTNDPQYKEWASGRENIYSTNGAVLTLFRRSPVADKLPDLFCMSLLTRFTGYYPNYSAEIPKNLNYLTWVVLKAHTRNRTGRVTLRSADPRDVPSIDFNYFGEGGDEDLAAMIDGIRFVRRLSVKLTEQGMIEEEEVPGKDIQTDDQLKTFLRANCWGHHASCTCPIGPIENGGVLDSNFRVHKTKGLRVVDASVFPRIPGFFIACSIYMIGEKAADVILSDPANRRKSS
jgi:choline dehydrogenase-like flavoprotein